MARPTAMETATQNRALIETTPVRRSDRTPETGARLSQDIGREGSGRKRLAIIDRRLASMTVLLGAKLSFPKSRVLMVMARDVPGSTIGT